MRALVAERRVGERLERVVQRRQLVRDPLEPIRGVEPPVESVHLVAEPVEALEDGVELPVIEVLALLWHRG